MPETLPSGLGFVVRATRAKTAPLIAAPVVVGSVLARDAQGSWGWSLLAVVGAISLHLGTMAFNDVADASTGADRIAGMDRSGVVTASGLIDAGATRRSMIVVGATMYAAAAACGAVLATRWFPVVWLGVAGVILGAGYAGKPLRYGYIGRGLGQVAMVAAYGILPTIGGAGVRTASLEPDAAWIGAVGGVLTAVALTVSDLLHHRSDSAVGKRTPAAVLGPDVALVIVLGMAVSAFAGTALLVAFEVLPALALIALVASIPFAAAWQRASADLNPPRALNLLGASLGASVLVQAWFALVLAI